MDCMLICSCLVVFYYPLTYNHQFSISICNIWVAFYSVVLPCSFVICDKSFQSFGDNQLFWSRIPQKKYCSQPIRKYFKYFCFCFSLPLSKDGTKEYRPFILCFIQILILRQFSRNFHKSFRRQSIFGSYIYT